MTNEIREELVYIYKIAKRSDSAWKMFAKATKNLPARDVVSIIREASAS